VIVRYVLAYKELFKYKYSIFQTQRRPAFVLLTAVIHASHTNIFRYVIVQNIVQAIKENDFVMRWDGQRRVRSERKLL
jgi:hypothetical protein